MKQYIAVNNLKEHKFIDWTTPEITSEMSLAQQAYHRGWNDAIDAIVENEPRVDVVEVVRCKDCFKKESCRTFNVWAVPPSDEWFCADGEKR